ncbi:MAG: hypothetical protein KBD01_07680 [Acidobacteria bacterium]|nr:hypothetical protein [Acidobacteriota bacterium]
MASGRPADGMAPIERLRRAARRWAGEDLCELSSDRPSFLWLYGSAMVEASAEPDGTIVLRAFLVLGPTHKARVREELEKSSRTLPAGRLELDGEGDVVLVHSIPPDTDPDELERAVQEICLHADRLDDLLCARLGGIRSLDLFRYDVMSAIQAAGGPEPLEPLAGDT